MNRLKSFMILFAVAMLLTGCKDIQLFEDAPVTEAQEITKSEMYNDVYYIKNGTRFSEVYMPQGTASKLSKRLDKSRIVYFTDDFPMLPTHYKGELIAYSSNDTDITEATLERFKDVGYSIGFYGGKFGEDGYYHIDLKKNICAGSEAETALSGLKVDEIKIKSIGGVNIRRLVDANTGVIKELEHGMAYEVEFYAGTYFYKHNFTADIHFMQAFEMYTLPSSLIADTEKGYKAINTPDYLKSGYYNINGSGLFIYHSYQKGEKVENENYNVGYYETDEETISSYSKQYKLIVPETSQNIRVCVAYGRIEDASDMGLDIVATLISPDGQVYEMENSEANKELSISLKMVIGGEWKVYVSPKSLEVTKVYAENEREIEDTSVLECEFEVAEDMQYQMFYADVTGSGSVYGVAIEEDGTTHLMSEYKTNKTSSNPVSRRYVMCQIPYLKAGTYKVKIWYYASNTTVVNLQLLPYSNTETDIFEIN